MSTTIYRELVFTVNTNVYDKLSSKTNAGATVQGKGYIYTFYGGTQFGNEGVIRNVSNDSSSVTDVNMVVDMVVGSNGTVEKVIIISHNSDDLTGGDTITFNSPNSGTACVIEIMNALNEVTAYTRTFKATITFVKISDDPNSLYYPDTAYFTPWVYNNTSTPSQDYTIGSGAIEGIVNNLGGADWSQSNGFNAVSNNMTTGTKLAFDFDTTTTNDEFRDFFGSVDQTNSYSRLNPDTNFNSTNGITTIEFENVTSGNYALRLHDSNSGSGNVWFDSHHTDSNDNVIPGRMLTIKASGGNWIPIEINMNESDTMTDVSEPNCADANTLITCLDSELKETQRPIMELKPGDFVKTYKRGYRRINRIGYMDGFNKGVEGDVSTRYVLRKTDSNGLSKDLFVSALHFVPMDELTEEQKCKEGNLYYVEEKYLLQARHHPDFEVVEENGYHRYYQMTLENDGDVDRRHGIWTDGFLTESTCEFAYENYLTGLKDVSV